MTAKTKKRLDVLVYEKGVANSRQAAHALIMAGKILVNERPADKPGMQVDIDAVITNRDPAPAYVSRGGLKLAHAIDAFGIDVTETVCLDVGASTGGFTDCLLQHGAERVYAVDVGYGQLDWKLRNNTRVIAIERTNIRHASADLFPEPFDLITIDVSFISLKIVIPAVLGFLKPEGKIVALIKPQFEVGKGMVGKGGVVRDPLLHQEVIDDLSGFLETLGINILGVLPSPITGPKGNREFLIYGVCPLRADTGAAACL
jgi:23S rRNA (cytidine1920-2'-O)/16S rRNA (cytidine1409-2'-O)-methyltransferase